MHLKSVFVGGIALGCMCLSAHAQDAGSLLREQERAREMERLQKLPANADEVTLKAPVAGEEAGETLLIRDIRFTGKVELLPKAERAAFVTRAVGQKMGVAGLQGLADLATFTLQKKGFLLARAILPAQDITEGVVTIEIVDGQLAGIEIARGQGARIRDGLLKGIIEGRVDFEGVTKADLESALLRANDLPGVTVKSRLEPGEAPNTSRLVVGVEEASIFSGALSADNFGSASTGRAQANGDVTLTDVTGFGDLTSLAVTASQGMRYGTLAVGAPISSTGLTASASYGYLAYENIDDVGAALGLNGNAHSFQAGLDHALLRSRDFNLSIGASASYQALRDDSLFGLLNDRRVMTGTLSLSGDARHNEGITFWDLGWSFGNVDLSRLASEAAADAAGLNTQGNFHRVDAMLARLQDLPGDFSLMARVSGQAANKNLDSSQDFALGGPYGVRGYPVGEGRGDMGLTGTLELRYDAPVPAGNLQLFAFLDGGHVRENHSPVASPFNACGCNDWSLASSGVGAQWSDNNFNLAATYAHTLGGNPGATVSGSNDNHAFWLQGGVRF